MSPGPTQPAEEGRRLEMLLTLAAAGIATAVAVTGMWRVFGDALGFTGPGRIALAGFLEIALMVSAIRARRSLREHGTVGVDGAAVWALAGLSAVLAAADSQGLGRAVRFSAPLVAAWLWERGMAAERRRTQARPRVVIAWRWTRERLAVRAGLAEPVARATSDVDRARRLARLTRARLRLAVLETSRLPRPLALVTARPLRIAWATWRLQRQALAAVEHLALGQDPAIARTIRTTVAAVVGLRGATAPGALDVASPWTPPNAAAPALGPTRPPGLSQAPSAVAALTQPRPTATSPAQVRPEDLARLRAAIAAGELPAAPAVETVRQHLQIGKAYARAARAALDQAPADTAP